MAQALRVTGVRELQRAAREAGGDAPKLVRARLKKVGDLVRVKGAELLEPLSSRSASGYRTYVRQRGVTVEQSRRRTTGERGDWGTLQMRRILVPALESQESALVVEAEMAVTDIQRVFER